MSDTAAGDEPLIVSVSGLRGVVGRGLDDDVAARYAGAFVATLPPGAVVLGRDGRSSGPDLATAIAARVAELGRDVIDCGVAATPTIGVAVRERQAAGGIQISASHNPARYNGMKLFSAAGRVLTAAAGREVSSRFEAALKAGPPARVPRGGTVTAFDAGPAHAALVAAIVDVAAIRRRRPRVWLDSGHGAGSRVARPLLEHLGCDVTIEGGVPDGLFEHEPEPTAENLAAWLPRIRPQQADVGFFQDPDADRLAIATADGRYIGEEATLALAVEAVLARTPGPIVVNCSTSGMSAALAARHGVPCHVSAVGEANVVDAMLASGAVLGGEGNGGVIDPRVVLVRDSFVAMALVLERLAQGDAATTVDGLARALPTFTMKKAKVGLAAGLRGRALAEAIDRVAAVFPEAEQSRLDGLRLDWHGGWLLVRPSNTEPIVRIVCESVGADPGPVDDAIARATAALSAG